MSTEPDHPHSHIAAPDQIQILQRPVDHPDAARLLRAFYDEQVDRYGFAESVDLDPAQYAPPHGIFAVVYHHGRPVGCGCYRWYPPRPGTVEIKKTYLCPDLRGRGVGRALLAWLEHHGAAAGARHVILETGVRNTAALRLFAAAGYRPAPRYVPGRPPEINRAFTKPLTPQAAPPHDAAIPR